MSYKVYSEYKDSGVEWLDIIPSSWSIVSAKRLFGNRRTVADDSDEQLAASQKYGVIPQKLMIEKTGNKVALALKGTESFKKVHKNDFVISLRSFEGGIEYSAYSGCISPAYTVLYPIKKMNVDYYTFLNKSSAFISALQATTDSLRDGKAINYEQFCSIDLPFPPVEEQERIASFLDHEIAKLERLINKQERLIDLLKEKRQSIISKVTTAHDDEKKLKLSYCIDLLPGYAFPSSGYQFEKAKNIRLLRGVNVGVDSVRWEDVVYWDVSDKIDLSAFELRENDIVIGMDRPWISAGARVAEISKEDLPCLLLQRVARIRVNNDYYQPFIKMCLSSYEFKAFIESDLTGISVPHLSPEQIKSFQIRDINKAQQKQETDKAVYLCNKLKEIESKANEAIKYLAERRSALISAAVTGKIDVRNWQPDAKDVA
ncbi:TPA: restriction endonuclease subunit S [Escherichia coli]|uniref:restriction endonuclease subunit S n=1 Tax=Escherichia coli TaxID=562 RepID=UPI000A186053|nr:restriction endonuclease subunit S [Escherichia coli]OSK75741.1 type I restriction-modification system specificity subunit [Escherichia coli H001]